MGWRHGRSGLTSGMFMLGAVVLLIGCSKEAPQAAEAHTARDASAQPSEPEVSEAGQSVLRGAVPGDLEFMPFDKRLLDHAGTLDRANRYVSTVMVALQEPTPDGGCSGVLLHSRLALTAAHCVCPQRQTALFDGGQGANVDGTTCAERATVTTVTYEASENPERPTLRIRSYTGQVHPHPLFQIRPDAVGTQRTNQADLAVVFLDQPVEPPVVDARLSDSEVHAQESLIMVGYGHDRIVGSRHGARYFRKNQVTRAPSPTEEQALYAQQGASLYEGFDGGPCFREDGQGPSLVGIASLSTGHAPSFTSTFVYRDWLSAELERAKALGTAASPGPRERAPMGGARDAAP